MKHNRFILLSLAKNKAPGIIDVRLDDAIVRKLGIRVIKLCSLNALMDSKACSVHEIKAPR